MPDVSSEPLPAPVDTAPSPEELRRWLHHSVSRRENLLTHGYQGEIYVYQEQGTRRVIKVPGGRGPARWLRGLMHRREHRIYRRLEGYAGAPRCYGLLDRSCLVLDYVEGVPYRYAEIHHRERFFTRLLELIREMHRLGVAHGDLKKKDNLMVCEGEEPCLIDFGTAVIRKPGLAPFNHFLFRTLRQVDYNAWLKLKYKNDLSALAPEDEALYHRTWPERLTTGIKGFFLRLRWPDYVPHKRRRAPRLEDLEAGSEATRSSSEPPERAPRGLGMLSSLLLIPHLRRRLAARSRSQELCAAPPLAYGANVLLQTFDGKLVTPADESGTLRATSSPAEEAEVFELLPAPLVGRPDPTSGPSPEGDQPPTLAFGRRLVLRASGGGFLRVEDDPANRFTPNAPELAGAEVFELVRSPKGSPSAEPIGCGVPFALRSFTGHHLRYAADRDGTLTVSVRHIRHWETFTFASPAPSDRS